MINADVFGENIAFHRRRRGLSQTEFAKLLDRSESWVSQVERGARVIDRLTVLSRVGEVLDVPLSELVGDDSPFPVRPNAHPEAAQLRRVLGTPYALRAFIRRANNAKDKPQNISDLRKRVAPLWGLAHRAAFSDLCKELAGLIPDLEVAARQYSGEKRRAVYELLLTTYQVTAALLAKLGEADAVWVAGDRAMAAAEVIDDPLQAVASAFRLALAFVSAHRLDEAIYLAQGAVDAISPYCSDDDPRSWSICGALHLALATATARVNDPVQARKHIRQAQKCAQRRGDGYNDFETEFGPTNVALQAVSVEVELGNAGEALRLAERIDPSGLSPERRSAFRMSLAMANLQRRQASEAIRHLEAAEQETPEQIHRNPRARQIVLDLLRNQRSDVTGLSQLAARMDLSNDLPVQKVLDNIETAY